MSTVPAMRTIPVVSTTPLPPPTAYPRPIPDDMLYEVVDGQIVEKNMGSREIEIAAILVVISCSLPGPIGSVVPC